jgi:hypothetical protein
MNMNLLIGVGAIAASLFAVYFGRRWQRRQKSSRLADVLLSDVLKAKDSYRR